MAQDAKQARPRLGRGLSSLIINSSPSAQDDGSYVPHQHHHPLQAPAQVAQPAQTTEDPSELAIDLIGPNPFQPRKDFRSEELADLAKSIAIQGILQPLIVVKAEEPGAMPPFTLIAGERRLRAARMVGLATVPCVVRIASKQQMLEWAIIENIQRSDLNPVERAHAYREYMDRFKLTQADAAERLGQPRTTVANHLRILDLCDEIQQMIVVGSISFGHAKVLAGMPAGAQQLALARKIADGALTVRELEQLAAQPAQAPAEAKPSRTKPPYIKDLEEQLCRSAGTRVSILPGRAKNTGRIVLEYYNLDDFDRLAKALGLQLES